jgi:hypothetical protein
MNRSIGGLRKVAERVKSTVPHGKLAGHWTNVSHLNTPSTQGMSVRLLCFSLLFVHLMITYTTELRRDG